MLLGADQARACLRARLPRRGDVVLVAPAAPPRPAEGGAGPDPWADAERLGAAYVACLPAAEPWLVDRLAGMPADQRPTRHRWWRCWVAVAGPAPACWRPGWP